MKTFNIASTSHIYIIKNANKKAQLMRENRATQNDEKIPPFRSQTE